ncbi:MAG: hypothetical protein AAF449_12545, partial [Myxococcota bacterium]
KIGSDDEADVASNIARQVQSGIVRTSSWIEENPGIAFTLATAFGALVGSTFRSSQPRADQNISCERDHKSLLPQSERSSVKTTGPALRSLAFETAVAMGLKYLTKRIDGK